MKIKYKFTELAKELMDKSKDTNKVLDFTPVRIDDGSSGYDLSACISEPLTLWQDQIAKIPTGVHIWIGENISKALLPENFKFAGLYLPRSSSPGLKLENTVGLLDENYQGESFLKYKNTSDHCVTINPGDRIGQLVIIPTYIGDMVNVEEFSETTTRGTGGFGSSGR